MSKPNNPASDKTTKTSLYAEHEKVYPRKVDGIFTNLRWLAVSILLGCYYLTAWINWNGRQILLFDLPERKFHILLWTFWPQDFFYLAIILIAAALSLFFFTALAGRLWCGYACPQTVWAEVFMWFEYKIEGDRSKQMKLDKMPWNAYKIRTKLLKHIVWAIFALWTGFTFVGYFTPIRELWASIWTFNTGSWETFWIFFYSFATWGNAGFMREQVCIYMCPYARFQSAMFDADTMIISYDEARGEPRGSRRRSDDPAEKGLGSCINCDICVQVCPTGIDIRNGQQYQCIGCAACIDACDNVMEKMGYEKGLVRYTTMSILSGGKPNILRPRIMVYGAFLLALLVGLLVAIINRVPLELDVIRDRNKLYSETYSGMIENVYTLKLINKDQIDHKFRITASGIDNIIMTADKDIIPVSAGEVVTIAVRLKADPSFLPLRSMPITFQMQATDDERINTVEEAKFIGPLKK